jgi:hypothetical protein
MQFRKHQEDSSIRILSSMMSFKIQGKLLSVTMLNKHVKNMFCLLLRFRLGQRFSR